MTAPQSLKLFQIAQRYFNNIEDATAFVAEMEASVDSRIESKLDALATKVFVREEIHTLRVEMKEQKVDLMKAIYLTGLVQFLAIMSSVVGIVMIFLKK